MQHITGPCSDGSMSAVHDLHLCAAGSGSTPPNSTNSSAAGSSGSGGDSILSSAGSHMLTDKGLMKLVAWPRLAVLVLGGMPGISLAGVKALVTGCPSLSEVTVKGCPAVSAAPAESVSKAAVGPGGRAVDLWVV